MSVLRLESLGFVPCVEYANRVSELKETSSTTRMKIGSKETMEDTRHGKRQRMEKEVREEMRDGMKEMVTVTMEKMTERIVEVKTEEREAEVKTKTGGSGAGERKPQRASQHRPHTSNTRRSAAGPSRSSQRHQTIIDSVDEMALDTDEETVTWRLTKRTVSSTDDEEDAPSRQTSVSQSPVGGDQLIEDRVAD